MNQNYIMSSEKREGKQIKFLKAYYSIGSEYSSKIVHIIYHNSFLQMLHFSQGHLVRMKHGFKYIFYTVSHSPHVFQKLTSPMPVFPSIMGPTTKRCSRAQGLRRHNYHLQQPT